MNRWYRAYGLAIQSNDDIPGLLEIASKESADLQIVFGELPFRSEAIAEDRQVLRYVSQYLDQNGEPGLTIRMLAGGAYYRFHYTEGIDYYVDAGGSRLWITWDPDLPLSTIFSYLLGPVLGLILRIRGYVALHASAVDIDRKAVLFPGYNMAGKSTMAMALARLGYPVLSDDIVPLFHKGRDFWAAPAYPRMRLRRSSIDKLATIQSNQANIPETTWDKRLHYDLVKNEYQFQSSALEVGAIYFLGPCTLIDQKPYAKPIPTNDRLLYLIGNTYASRFLDKKMRAEEFDFLSEVARRVPIRVVTREANPASLLGLCEAVIDDVRSIS